MIGVEFSFDISMPSYWKGDINHTWLFGWWAETAMTISYTHQIDFGIRVLGIQFNINFHVSP